jgi:hypothetical protein
MSQQTVQPLGDMNRVRMLLLMRGYRSLSAWAKAHGFKPVTARRVVYDWAHRGDREPHGGIARDLMRKLRETVLTTSA